MTENELFVVTTALCLLKIKLVDKCEEQMGAAACSAAEQLLTTGDIDFGEVGKDWLVSKGAEGNELVQAALKFDYFNKCYSKVKPQLRSVTVPITN